MATSVPVGAVLEDLCFEAQQAAEKAVKAVFVKRGESFPYIHNLDRLLGLLRRNGQKVPRYVLEAGKLSRYAFETRYPGMSDQVSRREYHRAARIATAVVRWAERQVVGRAPRPNRKR
jgi:HEPN domain-containing protein